MRALTLAMESAKEDAEIFNVCTGIETSLLQLIQTLGEILKIEPQIAFAPARAGDILRSVGDASRLKDRLKVTPATSLGDGLKAVMASK